jgi:hypothetical protein
MQAAAGADAAAASYSSGQAAAAAYLLIRMRCWFNAVMYIPAGLDFEEHFLNIRPQLLVVTEDDKYGQAKRDLCAQVRSSTPFVSM